MKKQNIKLNNHQPAALPSAPIRHTRLFLIAWVILPLVLVWLSVGYLIGINQQPKWNQASPLAQATVTAPPPAVKAFNWTGQGGVVTLWFDDAWRSQYYVALPVLQQKGFVAAMATPTHLVDTNGYMNWAQLKRLQHLGWEITSHTQSHNCDLIYSNVTSIDKELTGAKRELESQGLLADHFVTPCGADSAELIQIAKREYLSLRTSGTGFNPIPVTEPYSLKTYVLNTSYTFDYVKKLIQEAQQTNTWLILSFHQIDHEGREFSVTPELFNQIIDEIDRSGIQVALPSQVLNINNTALTQK